MARGKVREGFHAPVIALQPCWGSNLVARRQPKPSAAPSEYRSEPHIYCIKMAPQVGLESTAKRKHNNLQSTDGNQSTRKAVVVHVI